MAKKINKKSALTALALAAAISAPVAGVYANTVHISVNVEAVASVSVEQEETADGVQYTATVDTNSINGYDLYVSGDGEEWTLIKSVDHYPSAEERVATSTTNSKDAELKFKVEPRK